MNQYHLLELVSKDLLRGIATLGRVDYLRNCFLTRLNFILHEVQTMVKKIYPDYQLAADHISHYQDIKLVTFAVNSEKHKVNRLLPLFVSLL